MKVRREVNCEGHEGGCENCFGEAFEKSEVLPAFEVWSENENRKSGVEEEAEGEAVGEPLDAVFWSDLGSDEDH